MSALCFPSATLPTDYDALKKTDNKGGDKNIYITENTLFNQVNVFLKRMIYCFQ